MATRIKLSNVRLSFPHLFVRPAMTDESGKPMFDADGKPMLGKFSSSFLIHKDDQKDVIKKVDAAIDELLIEKFGTLAKAPKSLKRTCFVDGDTCDYDGYENHMAFKGTNKSRFTIINRDKTPVVEDDNVLYAGCYVNAIVSLWYSDHPRGGKQVIGNLHGIQFFKEGESFGDNNKDCSDEFDAFDDDVADDNEEF